MHRQRPVSIRPSIDLAVNYTYNHAYTSDDGFSVPSDTCRVQSNWQYRVYAKRLIVTIYSILSFLVMSL